MLQLEIDLCFIYSVLCSVLGFFVLLATLYDYFLCEDQSKDQSSDTAS